MYLDKVPTIRIKLVTMMYDLRRMMKKKDKANISFHNIILENFEKDSVTRVRELAKICRGKMITIKIEEEEKVYEK